MGRRRPELHVQHVGADSPVGIGSYRHQPVRRTPQKLDPSLTGMDDKQLSDAECGVPVDLVVGLIVRRPDLDKEVGRALHPTVGNQLRAYVELVGDPVVVLRPEERGLVEGHEPAGLRERCQESKQPAGKPCGAAIAVGVPPIERPCQLDAHTPADADTSMQVTGGWLRTDQRNYAFTLRWQGGPGRPGVTQVGEVIGGRADSDGRVSPYQMLWWHSPARIATLPRPRIDLDPVATALWHVELTRRGFPLLLRCLAAWWRVEAMGHGAAAADLAAAVARLIAARAGTQVTIDAMARQYDADPAAVRAAGTELRRLLQLSPRRGW